MFGAIILFRLVGTTCIITLESIVLTWLYLHSVTSSDIFMVPDGRSTTFAQKQQLAGKTLRILPAAVCFLAHCNQCCWTAPISNSGSPVPHKSWDLVTKTENVKDCQFIFFLLENYTFTLLGLQGIFGLITFFSHCNIFHPYQNWKGGGKSFVLTQADRQTIPSTPNPTLW